MTDIAQLYPQDTGLPLTIESDRPWFISYERYNIAPTITLPPKTVTLVDLCELSFANYGEQTAYIFDNTCLSYAELDQLSKRVAGHFQAMGLQQGETIGVMLPNVLHYPIVALAAIRAGLILVSFNPNYTVRELAHHVADSCVTALVLLDSFADKFEQLPHTVVKAIRHVVLCRYSDVAPTFWQTMANATLPHSLTKRWSLQRHFAKTSFRQLAANLPNVQWWLFGELLSGTCPPYQRPHLSQQDVALIQYTGGTTGMAKGAMLTHGNLLANLLQIDTLLVSAYDDEGQGDTILTALPLYHVFSFTMGCLLAMYKGFQSLLIDNPSHIKQMVTQFRRYPPSFILGVNPLFYGLLQEASFRQLDFSSLKATIGGGMPISASIAKHWHAVTGVPIVEGYGLSETAPVTTFNPLTIAHFNSKVGIPAPATDVQLLDEHDRPVPIGERGEIVIKGPQVMLGYHNLPEQTAQAFTPQGYLRTGDIGIMDEQGFIKIVDRKKDMLVVSGFNVYPIEIETVMLEHPDVLECAAIGVPSPTRGEEPKIFVVTHNPQLTAAMLIDYGKSQLTGYKRPRHVEFVNHLPKSSLGKVLRRELRKREGLE